jgi:spore maturation protein SpmB
MHVTVQNPSPCTYVSYLNFQFKKSLALDGTTSPIMQDMLTTSSTLVKVIGQCLIKLEIKSWHSFLPAIFHVCSVSLVVQVQPFEFCYPQLESNLCG